VVDDPDSDGPVADRCGQGGRLVGGRVTQRVADQVGQSAFEQAGVGGQQGQGVGDVEAHPFTAVESADDQWGDLVEGGGTDERLHRAGVDAGHVEQVADQRVEPVGALLDGRQQRAWSSAVQAMSVCRSVLTAAFTEASGVRRSWLTAASSAVRIRLPASRASACPACIRSRCRSRAAAACAA
jgi:hypothetical protein